MSFTHKITEEYAVAGYAISASHNHTGDGDVSRNVSVPDESTDMLVNLAIDVSQIKSIFILSDQALTLETNDGDAPDDTITLVAGVPYVWHENSYFTNKLTTDVTALYVTNASGAAATLKIEAVVDATP